MNCNMEKTMLFIWDDRLSVSASILKDVAWMVSSWLTGAIF